MSNQMNKATVPVADLPKKERIINSISAFTNNFFNLTPVYRKPVYVGDSIVLRGQKVSRTLPMPYPAFSCVNDVYRAYFVPYASVFKGSTDFFEQANHFFGDGNEGQILRTPHCTWADFCKAFTINSIATVVEDNGIYDFICEGSKYKFTQRGAQIYKVILGLGYDIVGSQTSRDLSDYYCGLLPLLCYLRVFFDWYWPRNYSPSGNLYGRVRGFLSRDISVGTSFTYSEVQKMLLCVGYSFYDDKDFVDCWDSPTGPNDPTLNSASSSINIKDIDPNITDGVVYDVSTADSAYMNSKGIFTKFALNALNSLSDFLKRNQLAGSTAIQRFLARHGKKLVFADDRSILLGEDYIPVTVKDVSATSEGANFNLGDLAGKGWSDGVMKFELKDANNRGMFLVLCSTLPDGELFQGVDKYNLATTALEFYQPEFYNNGVGAVAAIEVYNNPASTFNLSSQLGKNLFTKVFGFYPIWYQYNMLRNIVIGDFRVPSRGESVLSAAHSFRVLNDDYFVNSIDNVVHSLEFQYGLDASQYQRLTYLANAGSDFIQSYIKWVTEYYSSIPLSKDTYSFDSDAEHNHGSVTLDTGGVEKS